MLLTSSYTGYLSLLFFLFLAVAVPAVLVVLSRLIGNRTHGAVKDMPYECGNLPSGSSRQRFSVKFYLVAVLFILFDVEAVFLYPWAVTLRALGLYGLCAMLVFIGVLALGLAYVWRKGALDWN